MKKILALLISLSIITGSLFILPISTHAEGGIDIVYLNGASGAEENSGETPTSAVATLKTAFTKLGTDGGVIVVCGDTIVDSNLTTDDSDYTGHNIILPEHTGKVYITSNNGSKLIKALTTAATTFTLNGPVEFFNITLYKEVNNQNFYIYANSNPVTIGYGVVCELNTGGTVYPKIYGIAAYGAGSTTITEKDITIDVYSGNWGEISGVGTSTAGSLKGNVTINICGGKVGIVRAAGSVGVDGTTEVNLYNKSLNSVTEITNVVLGTTGSGKIDTVTGTRTLNLYNGISIDEAPQTDASRETFSTINKNLTGTAKIPDSAKLSRTYYSEFANDYDYFGTMSGAQTRISSPSGLRFSSIITKSYYDNLVSTYGDANVTLGTIIAPLSYIVDDFTIEELTTSGKTFLNVEQTMFSNSETAATDGYYKFNAAIVGIKGTEDGFNSSTDPDNRSVNFAARAYVKIVEGENTTYIYSQFDFGANVRNVAYVANAAVNDTGAGYTSEQLSILNKFIP